VNQLETNFQPLSASDFAALGNEHIAYVRSIALPDGKIAVGVFAADGRPLATVPSIEIAQALVRQNDLEPTLVH